MKLPIRRSLFKIIIPKRESRKQRMERIILRAIDLIVKNEPVDGYYLAFSGGKDSCVIKELAKMSNVKFEAWYNCTTIDPSELVRFIKSVHPDVKWNLPKFGNMMHRVATRRSQPPTRLARWCCAEYKEGGGGKKIKIFGVRADESRARAKRWKEIALDTNGVLSVCPIVYWSDIDVWEFLKSKNVPYCSLYDEGWTRLGCVGCPLASRERQKQEFARWPAFERNWKKAIIKNWENLNDKFHKKDSTKRFWHSKFKSGEELWKWWINEKTPNIMQDECQSQNLMVNEEIPKGILLKNKSL